MFVTTSFANSLHSKLFLYGQPGGFEVLTGKNGIIDLEKRKNYSKKFNYTHSPTLDVIVDEWRDLVLLRGNMREFSEDFAKAETRWQYRWQSLTPEFRSFVDSEPKLESYHLYLENVASEYHVPLLRHMQKLFYHDLLESE